MSDCNTITPDMHDPFDPNELAKLRLGQNFAELASVKANLTSVAVRKPHKQEFIRVRPGGEHRFDTGCFVDKDSRDTYIVSPEIWGELVGYVTPTLLVVCQTQNSPVPFLWPLAIPDSDRPNRWHRSALECARLAEEKWLKVMADMIAGQYVPYAALGNLPEPSWSDVPDVNEMMRLAFQSRFINSVEHPVVRKLRGEV